MAFDIKVTLHFMHFDVIPNEKSLVLCMEISVAFRI